MAIKSSKSKKPSYKKPVVPAKVSVPTKKTGLGVAGAGGANKAGGVGPAKVVKPNKPDKEKGTSSSASLQIQNMTPTQYESWRAQTNEAFKANANAAIAAQLTAARGGRTEAEYQQYLDTINTNYILGNTSPALQQQALDKYVSPAASVSGQPLPQPQMTTFSQAGGPGPQMATFSQAGGAGPLGVAGATVGGVGAGTGQYAPPRRAINATAGARAGQPTGGVRASLPSGGVRTDTTTAGQRYGVAGATTAGVTAGTGQYAPPPQTQATQMAMPQGNYDLADLQGVAGVGGDYAATYRYLQEAEAGRYMGLLTPNMVQLLGLTSEDLLAMGYGPLANGSWIRYDPTGSGTGGSGVSYGSSYGGGRGGGGGGWGGYGPDANLVNWRIGV